MLGVGAAGRRPCRRSAPSLGRHPWHAPGSRAGRRGAGRPGQYARAVTPEQLQDVVRTAVRGGRRPRRAAPSRCPTRSSSSARRTPSTATTPPTWPCGWPRRPAGRRARWPSCSPRSCARSPASRAVDVAGPGFLNITLAAGRARADRRPGGHRRRGLRPHRGARRAAAEPGVRLGQPDRPGAHRRHPLGGRRRRARPAAGGQRRRGHPGVLLQRRRRADRPVRPQPAGGRAGPAGARGRLRRRLHRRHRRAGGRRRAGPARAGRRRAAARSSGRAASS